MGVATIFSFVKKLSPILGMVHHHRYGVASPSRLHLVAGLLQVGGVPPGDVDGGASLAELQGDASADAAACPGDQGYAAVQRGGHFYAVGIFGCYIPYYTGSGDNVCRFC